MSHPLVSVIIPTFNRAAVVGQAIDSVLNQHYGNLECIVVDDGSTDDTALVIQAYTDPRLIYIQTENQGLASARNEGLERAKGAFVAFCDSDDYLYDDFLSYFVALSDEHPDVDFFYGTTYWDDVKQEIFPMMPDQIQYHSGISAMSMFIRQSSFVRFYPNMRFMEDWYFTLELLAQYSFKFVHKCVGVVCAKTADCLTENNDLCEGYKHIVMTYMREHIHVKPEVLVVVNCVNNNVDLSFFLLNHLRLFLDRRFDVVFDMSSCAHAKKKLRTLEKWGYRVCLSQEALARVVQDSSCQILYHTLEFVIPTKGFFCPTDIKDDTVYRTAVFSLSGSARVNWFHSYWIPSPSILVDYEGSSEEKMNNDAVYFCQKTHFLSPSQTPHIEEDVGKTVAVNPQFHRIFGLSKND